MQIKLMQLHVDNFKRSQNCGENLVGMHGTGFTQLAGAIPGDYALG
jgi:hypothetical protein